MLPAGPLITPGQAKQRDTPGASIRTQVLPMLTTTHFAVVVLAAMLLRLNKDEWFIALLFGVVVDADHMFALPRYVSDNGWSALLRQTWDDGSGLPWKSWLHYPQSAIVVGHLSVGWRFALPLAFWAPHLGMDWLQLQAAEYNTVLESAILFASVAGIVYVGYSRWSLRTGGSGLSSYAVTLSASTRGAFAGLRAVISGFVGRN